MVLNQLIVDQDEQKQTEWTNIPQENTIFRLNIMQKR
jgi:hypothetical protein